MLYYAETVYFRSDNFVFLHEKTVDDGPNEWSHLLGNVAEVEQSRGEEGTDSAEMKMNIH